MSDNAVGKGIDVRREWQRGQVFKHRNGTWGYRYRDYASGKRPQRTGFSTKGGAQTALRAAMATDHVEAATLSELVERFLDQYPGSLASRTRLSWSLRKATDRFGTTALLDVH